MKTRKFLIGLLVLVVGARLFADTVSFTQGRWTIRMNDSFTEITICGINDVQYNESVTIPDNFDGVPVTAIGDGAFSYTSIGSVTIPSSVKKIGYNAFYNCDNLTSFTIPDSVTSMGNSIFSSCDKLSSVVLPKGTTYIPESMFYNCYNLTSVTVPSTVTEIKREAFKGCKSLNLTIPATVTTVGRNIFSGCATISLSYKIQVAKKYNVDIF